MHALFDAVWYQAHYPDVPPGDALTHYRRHGRREGRWPNAHFDPAHYLGQIDEAVRADPAFDPVAHYAASGERAGLSPCAWFDPAWYRAVHRIGPEDSALAHFLAARFDGKTSPNPGFDTRFYLAAHPDVAASGIDPYDHYRRAGRLEGRLPRPEAAILGESGLFDARYYSFVARDVAVARIDPLTHYLTHGAAEGRRPNAFFDPAWHVATYGAHPRLSPLTHYVLGGEAEGQRPSLAFDPGWYRAQHGLADGRLALADYLARRMAGEVSPLPLFDLAFYKERYGSGIPRGRDPFAFHLAIGAARDDDPAPWFAASAYRRRCMTDRDTLAALPLEARTVPLLHLIAVTWRGRIPS